MGELHCKGDQAHLSCSPTLPGGSFVTQVIRFPLWLLYHFYSSTLTNTILDFVLNCAELLFQKKSIIFSSIGSHHRDMEGVGWSICVPPLTRGKCSSVPLTKTSEQLQKGGVCLAPFDSPNNPHYPKDSHTNTKYIQMIPIEDLQSLQLTHWWTVGRGGSE